MKGYSVYFSPKQQENSVSSQGSLFIAICLYMSFSISIYAPNPSGKMPQN